MEEAPLSNPEFDESDKRFRALLKACGFEGKTADDIIDRTRGDVTERHKWYVQYGHLLKSEQNTQPEDKSESTT